MTETKGWPDEGKKIEGDIIGRGFVQWGAPGEHVRGVFLRRWQTPTMQSEAAVIRLTEIPDVHVLDTTDRGETVELELKIGDVVNVSLGFDLESKMGKLPGNIEIGIVYERDIETQRHTMRQFSLYHFDQLDLDL